MHLSKIIFYFSLIIGILSLTIAIILTFWFDSKVSDFISSISLNIFAGAIITIATSLVDYFIQRRRILIAILDKVIKYRNIFSKLEYLQSEDSIATYEEYENYYKNERNKLSSSGQYNVIYKKNELKRIKTNMEKIMDTYIEISNIDFSDTWLLWDELYFIKPFYSKRKREWFYNEVFNYIYDLLNKIREEAYHFKIYKNGFQNYKVNYNIMRELQEKIFYYEERFGDDYDWNRDIKNYPNKTAGADSMTNKHYIAINDVSSHLNDMVIEIRKLYNNLLFKI